MIEKYRIIGNVSVYGEILSEPLNVFRFSVRRGLCTLECPRNLCVEQTLESEFQPVLLPEIWY